MVIVPLGVLLNTNDKRASYQFLLDHFEEMIPYVGTGLSHYCKSWGAPFEIVMSDIKSDSSAKDNYFYQRFDDAQQKRANKILSELGIHDTSGVKCLKDCLKSTIEIIQNETHEDLSFFDLPDSNVEANNSVIWDSIQSLYNRDKFLELGEILDVISFIDSKLRFNLRFFRAIYKFESNAKKTFEDDLKLFESLKYPRNNCSLPPAVWFLPYFGENSRYVFTTNTDNTLEQVYTTMGIDIVKFTGKSKKHDILENEGKHHIIFHIHGYQYDKGTNTSETFVMTWGDYKKAYGDGDGSHMRMLIKMFEEEHFLFVGAKLKQDTTVKLMKKQAESEDAIDRHIAFMHNGDTGYEDVNELVSSMATQVICAPHWNQYPTILCSLVRESRKSEWSVYKDIINGSTLTTEDREGELVKKIGEFLSKDEGYSVFNKELSEADVTRILYPSLKELLVENNTRLFDWEVCRVNNLEFAFPIKDSNISCLDSYSAPLGNTIYILGGSKCTNKQVAKLEESIRIWTQLHEFDYWETSVKVRVFLVDCVGGMSPSEIISQLSSILIKMNGDNDVAKRSLLDLLRKMSEYATYSEMSLFSSLEEAVAYLTDNGLLPTIHYMVLSMLRAEIFQEYRTQLKNLQEEILPRLNRVDLLETKTKRLILNINEIKSEE